MFLEVTDLCIGYDGKSILDDICFQLASSSYLCIVGENGAGKSTLLKTITGLLKPIYGSVSFNTARHEIGYVPQQLAVYSHFPASAQEIISSGALSRGQWYRPFLNKTDKERITWASEKTGVTPFLTQCFYTLSGGQQRRVLLARALVTAKNAVILDEPTAGLDPDAAREFYALLHKINHDEKITVIMVTHDMEGVKKHATHVLELRNKTQSEEDDYIFGTADEFAERGRA